MSAVHTNHQTRIGRYQPFLKIGAGGMAQVYLAMQRGPFDARKLVVIKQLREEILEDDQMLAMFADEARIALRLSHPNVVHTYEVVAEESEHYIVMEFLAGHSLSNVLRRLGRKAMPLEEHIWILTQVLAGLQYAHELRDFDGGVLGIVHRDVSPSNVVVCFNGDVKLVDFGIAKASGAFATTQYGVMKGKIGYMAPEQFVGEAVDARSDIYAVGVMLWEAIARRRRTTGEGFAVQLHARVNNEEPAIEQVAPEAPSELIAITHRATDPDPDGRYGTAREFQADLEAFLQRGARKVGAQSVAELLRPHYDSVREELQRAIEAHLAGAPPIAAKELWAHTSKTGSRLTPRSTSDRPWSNHDEANIVDIPEADALLLPAESAALGTAPAPSAPTRRNGVLLAGIGAATAAIGLAAVTLIHHPETGSATQANVASELATAQPASAAPQATQPAAAPAAEIAVRISATPSTAVLWLDGQRLGQNPYQASLEADGKDHELRVTAAGHGEQQRTLRFDRSIEVSLALTPNSMSRFSARGQRPLNPRSTAAPAPAPTAAEPRVSPGMELPTRASPPSRRVLDEKDPFDP